MRLSNDFDQSVAAATAACVEVTLRWTREERRSRRVCSRRLQSVCSRMYKGTKFISRSLSILKVKFLKISPDRQRISLRWKFKMAS